MPPIFPKKDEIEQRRSLFFTPTDYTILFCFTADKYHNVSKTNKQGNPIINESGELVPFYDNLDAKKVQGLCKQFLDCMGRYGCNDPKNTFHIVNPTYEFIE